MPRKFSPETKTVIKVSSTQRDTRDAKLRHDVTIKSSIYHTYTTFKYKGMWSN